MRVRKLAKDLPLSAENQHLSMSGERSATPQPAIKKILQVVFHFLLVAAALVPIGYTTYQQWPEVRQVLLGIGWSHLLAAFGLLLVWMPLMALIPWLNLRHLAVHQPLGKVMGLYFISQLAKYLPGGIWAYPGRMVAYEASGIGRVQAIISVSREVAAAFLGAAIVALAGLGLGLPMPTWMQASVAFGMVCCIAAVFLTQTPALWRWLSRWKFLHKSALVLLNEPDTSFNLRWLGDTLLTSLIFWAGTGVAFLLLIQAVNPLAAINWLQAGSLFALAWCVGFVIIFLPAGFGAREVVISFLLKGFIPTADALAVALLARLWWMAAEAVYMAISPLLIRIKSAGKNPPN